MKPKIDRLLEWLEEFDNLPIKPTYRNMIEKIWELKSEEFRKNN